MNLFKKNRKPERNNQSEIILNLEDIGVSEDYFETHPFLELSPEELNNDTEDYYLIAELELEKTTNETNDNETYNLLDENTVFSLEGIDPIDLLENKVYPKKTYNLLDPNENIDFSLPLNDIDSDLDIEVFNLTIKPKTTKIQINFTK